MQLITLPGGSRATTRLGFGTAGLHGGWFSRSQSLRLLETAYDCGIRHIDTAPLYGLGYAEAVVGEFLAAHEDVTVTTKFGLRPPKAKGLWELARAAGKPLVKLAPGLKRHLLRALPRSDSGAARQGPGPYSPEAMRRSLHESLRNLRRDHIDIFLLHEGTDRDLTDDVRREMDRLVADGTVGNWGLGSARVKIDAATASGIATPVAQFEWCPLDAPPACAAPFVVTHGAISGFTRALPSLPPVERDRWATLLDTDLADLERLVPQLLSAALAANRTGLVLFSSRQLHHVRQTTQVLCRTDATEAPPMQAHPDSAADGKAGK